MSFSNTKFKRLIFSLIFILINNVITSITDNLFPSRRYFRADFRDVITGNFKLYGEIYKIPPLFGKPGLVVTKNPNHFETVFRTEGQWPGRLVFESVQYYREKVRPDLYRNNMGLTISQGKEWGDFRTKVNPVMIQPKTVKLYIPTIDKVAADFLERIRHLRNPSTNQLPENFEDELNKWSLESIGVIAMDTRMGLISGEQDARSRRLIESVKALFVLGAELEIKPSMWKIIRTPKFKEMMRVLDTLTTLAEQYVNEAKEKLEKRETLRDDHELSVLEKLLKIDPAVATVMAIDMILAGVDTINLAVGSEHRDEYLNAAPVTSIPGPSVFSLLRSFLPGGEFHKADVRKMMRILQDRYGEILRFPGMFGKPSAVATANPDHFQIVLRTEGIWPHRKALETIEYYREKVRPDVFAKHKGLINSQGKFWSDFRTVVNPVLIHPKTAKLYIPAIDKVADDFINRMRQIRSGDTNQLPDNFEEDLNRWALESVGVIALDTRLGLISDQHNERAAKFIEAIKEFFLVVMDVEFKPSLWRIMNTPSLKKLMAILDTITELSSAYVEDAKARLEQAPNRSMEEREQSVLEKLLKIDPLIAKVMAMDMVFAGVDTTSSAFVSVLYLLAKHPSKQELLRREIMSILPDKTSSLTVENMARLPYLRACIKEAQRVLPTVNGNTREAGQDLVLSGYQVPKGTTIFMNSSLLHDDDSMFPDSKQFLPERWLRTEDARGVCPVSAKTAHPFAYMPFGFGPRMCIGRRLAEMEIEILLAKMIRNFNILWEHEDLKFRSHALNVPDGKLKFTLNDIDK